MNEMPNLNQARNEKTIRAVSYILLFLMMVCFIMTIDSLLRNALPGWHTGIISGILLFIVLDRLYTYQSFKSLALLSPEWAKTVGAQWVIIILFMRLLLSFANGPDAFMADMSLFARGHVDEFFNPEFAVTLLLAVFVWYLPGQFLNLLDEMGLDQAQALREGSAPFQGNALPAHQRLTNLVFNTGIVLVFFAALTRVNFRAILYGDMQEALFTGGETGALLYFILGLGLLSQSRLMSLQTRWGRQNVPVSSSDLPRKWGTYSLLFLLLLILFVGILPSGDSLGLFSLLIKMINFFVVMLLALFQLIFFLIALLISLPFLLFGEPAPFQGVLPDLSISDIPATPSEPAPENQLWAIIKSVALWVTLIAVIVFSLIAYMRQHGGLITAFRKTRFINWLITAWQWLRSNADSARKTLSDAIADGWQNIRSRLESRRLSPRSSWFSLRALDPRRQIYFFYLAMIRRGNEHGLIRKPSQTPSEYSASLENALPAVEEDIDLMTDAFIKARYSRENIDPGKVNLVKAAWGHVRRELGAQFKKK